MSQQPAPVADYANPTEPYAMKPRRRRLFGWGLFIMLCVVLFLMLAPNRGRQKLIDLSEFRNQLAQGNVASIAIAGDSLRGQFRRPVAALNMPMPAVSFRTELPPGVSSSWQFTQWLLENSNGAAVRADGAENLLMSIVVPLIPWALVFLFIWFFVFRQLRMANKREPMPVMIVNATDQSGSNHGPSTAGRP